MLKNCPEFANAEFSVALVCVVLPLSAAVNSLPRVWRLPCFEPFAVCVGTTDCAVLSFFCRAWFFHNCTLHGWCSKLYLCDTAVTVTLSKYQCCCCFQPDASVFMHTAWLSLLILIWKLYIYLYFFFSFRNIRSGVRFEKSKFRFTEEGQL